jgi:hypothetical protein
VPGGGGWPPTRPRPPPPPPHTHTPSPAPTVHVQAFSFGGDSAFECGGQAISSAAPAPGSASRLSARFSPRPLGGGASPGGQQQQQQQPPGALSRSGSGFKIAVESPTIVRVRRTSEDLTADSPVYPSHVINALLRQRMQPVHDALDAVAAPLAATAASTSGAATRLVVSPTSLLTSGKPIRVPTPGRITTPPLPHASRSVCVFVSLFYCVCVCESERET